MSSNALEYKYSKENKIIEQSQGVQIEKHHMIPLSTLVWVHAPRNIMELDKNIHKQLHDTLNIDMKTFCRMQRKIRQKINGMLVLSPSDIDTQYQLAICFFGKLWKLPSRLQHKHVQNMINQLDHSKSIYKLYTGTEYDIKPKRLSSTDQQFYEILEKKIEVEKATSSVLIQCIKKNLILQKS